MFCRNNNIGELKKKRGREYEAGARSEHRPEEWKGSSLWFS